MSDDATLAAPGSTSTPTQASGLERAPEPGPVAAVLSMEELLTSARRPRTHGHICLRADLQADYDETLEELAQLVDAEGVLLEDVDPALGQEGAAAKAIDLDTKLRSIKREMRGSMRRVTFEGMDSETWARFNAEHQPKKEGADLTDYNTRLVAAASFEPALSYEDVQKMRKTLGPSQMRHLANKAFEACTRGGIDLPKSLNFSLSQPQQGSGN